MKKKIKYYFFDDTQEQESLIDNLNKVDESRLIIEFKKISQNWNKNLELIIDLVENADGFLFDWQLRPSSDNSGSSNPMDLVEENESLYGFDSEAIVQQLRTLMLKGNIPSIPIILCSTDSKIKQLFNKDFSGYNLFDLIYNKSDFLYSIDKNNDDTVRFERYVNEFVALAEGYKQIEESKNSLSAILNKSEESLMFYQNNFYAYFDNILSRNGDANYNKQNHIHEFIFHLLNEFILEEGVLVSEYTLATRLGVSRQSLKSKTWKKFLEENLCWAKGLDKDISSTRDVHLDQDNFSCNEIKYAGVLSSAWERWWMFEVEDWWDEIFPEHSLRRSTPETKVQLINSTFKCDFTPIKKNEYHSSEYFWYNCTQTGAPIDSSDGILLAGETAKKNWLDKKYLAVATVVKDKLVETSSMIAPKEFKRAEKLLKKFNS